jgi:hypothetical protein
MDSGRTTFITHPITRNRYGAGPNMSRAHGSTIAIVATLTRNAKNHGTACRGPRARIAYAGTRKAHTSPGLEPVIPPPTTWARGTHTVPNAWDAPEPGSAG